MSLFIKMTHQSVSLQCWLWVYDTDIRMYPNFRRWKIRRRIRLSLNLCKLHSVVRSYSWMSRRREWIQRQEDRRGTSFRVSELDVRWSCQHISWTKLIFLAIALRSWLMDRYNAAEAPYFWRTSTVCRLTLTQSTHIVRAYEKPENMLSALWFEVTNEKFHALFWCRAQFMISAACICVNATYPMSINVMYKSWVLSSCWDGRPFDHNRHGPKGGGCCTAFHGGAGSPSSNTVLHGLRPTSVPGGILIHPTVWPEYTNFTDRQDRQDRTTVR